MKHLRCKPARLGVVSAAMVGIDHQQAIGQLMPAVVAERIGGLTEAERLQHRIVGDGSKCNHHTVRRHGDKLLIQEGITVFYLLAKRLVLGRQAFDGIGETAVDQSQPVLQGMRFRRTAESVSIESLIQKNTGIIAREGTPGCIGPMHAGGQTHDKHSGGGITEWGHGPGVVPGVFSLHLIEKTGQPLTSPAIRIE